MIQNGDIFPRIGQGNFRNGQQAIRNQQIPWRFHLIPIVFQRQRLIIRHGQDQTVLLTNGIATLLYTDDTVGQGDHFNHRCFYYTVFSVIQSQLNCFVTRARILNRPRPFTRSFRWYCTHPKIPIILPNQTIRHICKSGRITRTKRSFIDLEIGRGFFINQTKILSLSIRTSSATRCINIVIIADHPHSQTLILLQIGWRFDFYISVRRWRC